MKSGESKLREGFARDLKDELITPANLPPPDTKRWTVQLKAKVILAVKGEVITLEEALKRYSMTLEEFVQWGWNLEQHGRDGLQIKSLQKFRQQAA